MVGVEIVNNDINMRKPPRPRNAISHFRSKPTPTFFGGSFVNYGELKNFDEER